MRGPSAPSFSRGDLVLISEFSLDDYVNWYSKASVEFAAYVKIVTNSYTDNFSGKIGRLCMPIEGILGEGWYIHVGPALPDYAPGGLRLPVEWLKLVFES